MMKISRLLRLKRKKGFDKYYKETNMLLPFNI